MPNARLYVNELIVRSPKPHLNFTFQYANLLFFHDTGELSPSFVKQESPMDTPSFSLAYGTGQETFTCRGAFDRFGIREPEQVITEQIFRERLHAALAGGNLDLTRPAVVVADKTRLCGYPRYLPVLLEALEAHGADPRKIRICIAYGTHPPQGDDESLKAYGTAFHRYAWIQHRCDQDAFVDLGSTRRGTPVRLRADIHAASSLITFGAVSHHYFAGYGGGRKLIFPGLGEKDAIYRNHGLFLDPDHRRLTAGCRSGCLDGNPLAEDLEEYASFRTADLAVHGILDSRGRVCDLLVGRGAEHFRRACARHASHCEVRPGQDYDLVVASCGGFPKDINFIQSHKALHHAAAFVRDGGRLVLLAQCRDGIGSQTFLPWFQLGGWDAAFDRLAEKYMGNGGTALAMMAKLDRIRISLVTALDPGQAALIGFDVWMPAKVQECLDRHKGSLAVIANASLVVSAHPETASCARFRR
jgi:lactate racemase